ncbi:MAG: hypothetical protein V4636_13035 [Pseudomonadota bacterium]
MDTPPIVSELRERLKAAGWTVRKLKSWGFGSRTAEMLLGYTDGVPDVRTLERALALLNPPRSLWFRRA